uniref:autotransporter domain-containing protein n=1 Tax=Rickettsia tamurae TaxID=334545 RepID=UPI003899AE0E
MKISNKPKASNPLKDVPVEDHYKKIALSKSDVGKARKVRPPTRSKTFVDSEKTEQSQNTYTPEPTEQTPQKPEIIITASSPTVSPASNSFVTAPNTPNTTLTSPEHYTTAPSTPSTLATPYQPTPDSKPNDSVGVNTPPSTSSKVVQKLSFSSEPQQIVQLSKPTVPPGPITPVPLPIKKSSTEIAAGMVNNISRVNETIGIKLAEVTQAIKDTTGKKNKKPLQKLHTQLTSSQKTAKKLKSEAERIGQKIIALDKANTSLSDWNKKEGGIKNKHEFDKDRTKVGKSNKEIEKLKKELVSRNSEADTLFQKIEKIDIPVNKVSIKSQGTVPVTTASTKVSAFQAQQARINEAQQDVLGQNQQHIAAEKTKKQRQAEDKQRTEREKKRKEENHQKEKARNIVEIREDIAKKMQSMQSTMSGYSEILPKKLEELETRVGNIKDKKKKQEAQKQLSEIKKQEKAIKTAADKAKEVAASAKKETSRTVLRAMQDKMNGYSEQLNKIEENLKLLTLVVYNSSTGSAYKQPPKAKLTMPLSRGVHRILGEQLEDGDGYLVSTKVQQQPYTVMLSSQEIEDPKSVDLGLGSLSNGTLGKETDEDAGFYSGWGNMPYTQAANVNSSLEGNPVLGMLLQQMQENRSKVSGQLPSNPKDIYGAQASQYINYLDSIQPNQSSQAQIDGVIDSLVTEMRKLSAGQFNQKLDEIAHLANIKAYKGLFLKLYEIQQARVQKTQEVYEQAEIFQSYDENQQLKKASLKNTSAVLMQGTKALEALQQQLNAENSNLLMMQSILENINPTAKYEENSRKSNTPVLSSSSLAESVISSNFEEKSALLQTTTTDESLRSDKNWKNPESYSSSRELDKRGLEYLDLAGDAFAQNPVAKSDSLRKNNLSGSIPEIQQPQSEKIRTETSGMQNDLGLDLHSQEERFDSGLGSILQTNDAESSKRKRDGETSKQRTVDQEGGFGQGWGNEHHKESSLSVDSGLTKKAAQLISLLDAKRTEILQTTSPSQQKSLNLALQEIGKDYVDTYIRVLSNKIQEIEKLPGSSSRSEELNHIKEAMAYISNRIQDVEELDENMLLAINARLQEHDEKISSLLLEKYTSEEAEDILAQSLLQEMLVSDGKSESTLPTGDEEQEDTEVTDVSGKLSLLPVSSNEYALALSDGSEDEESYDSGFEEGEETIEQLSDSDIEQLSDSDIEQLSDSDGGNLKITEVDTASPLEQKAKKEMQTQISENAPTLNQAKVVNTIVNNMIRNRLDASMNMSNNMVAVGAGDEEESRIKRGLWMRGMYGTNNHGRVDNMTGYRGTNKGATIGFDVEIDNNILGIAYSNVHSVFKFKNSKNNDKELINSHVVSIYGQKELPRNFALQALVSASKNFIKDKTTYSYGDTKIRSNVKHRNHSYNAEALLNYNYLLQNKLVITPNIGLRYGKSRDGVYNETGINVQEIALTMKENNILSGIVGTKVKVPLKDALKFNNLGLTFQGAVEHNFKEKTQRINRVVKIFDNTFKQDYLIPKQPKTSYNLGTGIIGSIKNTTISLDYNYYLNKHYRSHQGNVKLKVNL